MIDGNGNVHDELGRFSGRSNAAPVVGLTPSPAVAVTAHLIAGGPEDDAAYIALADLSEALAVHDETVVIGGHAVSLYTAAFPAAGLVPRRTGDADAGIPLELANAGGLHAALTEAGYVAESGNRYVKPGPPPAPTIDLLVPSFDGRFGDARHGQRMYNTMPGLAIALGNGPTIHVEATLTDRSELRADVKVPPIDALVVLKAYAWGDRKAVTRKDLVDISNLLHVLDQHGPDDLGGWRLADSELSGSRKDAASILHELARELDAGRHGDAPIDPRKVTVLIRRWIAPA